MTPLDPPVDTESRVERLEREVQRAYTALGEVTSRLLLVQEASDAALHTHDRTELAREFLGIVERAAGTARAALFVHDGDALSLAGTLGLSDEEQDDLVASAQEVEACDRALAAGEPLVLDAAIVPEVPDQEPERADGDEEENGEENGDAPPLPTGRFAAYLPALLDGTPVCVLGLGERATGAPYDADDITFLSHVLVQIAVALNRSLLLERSQRRVAELDALLRVSREITATLDLDGVLRGIVNTAAAVVENDRCTVYLFEGGGLKLRAATGLTRLPSDLIETYGHGEVREWLRLVGQRVQVAADDLAGDEEPPGAEVFGRYFEAQTMRAFLALPLADSQGTLGFLCLERHATSWDLDAAEGDALDILAGQTTVAIRNAQLYSRIPMRRLASPVARAHVGWSQLSARRRRAAVGVAAACVLVAAAPILPYRVGGASEVLPARVYGVRAETAGVVRAVYVRGGDLVRAGQVLALLDTPDLAARVSELRSRERAARVQATLALERGDALDYRLRQLEAEEAQSQLAFEERRAARSRLVAPAAGRVLDLDLAEQEGRHLAAGDAFCRVSDLSHMRAETLVDEREVGRVRPGLPTRLKLLAYPTRVFHGHVSEVSWAADEPSGEVRRFRVRAEFQSPDLALRPGLTGQAKIAIGRQSLAVGAARPFIRRLRLAVW